jgi:hypothetical protein
MRPTEIMACFTLLSYHKFGKTEETTEGNGRKFTPN